VQADSPHRALINPASSQQNVAVSFNYEHKQTNPEGIVEIL